MTAHYTSFDKNKRKVCNFAKSLYPSTLVLLRYHVMAIKGGNELSSADEKQTSRNMNLHNRFPSRFYFLLTSQEMRTHAFFSSSSQKFGVCVDSIKRSFVLCATKY
jgi:hypothetical protein